MPPPCSTFLSSRPSSWNVKWIHVAHYVFGANRYATKRAFADQDEYFQLSINKFDRNSARHIQDTCFVSSQYIDIYKTARGVPTQYANESSDITEIDTQESQNNKNDTTWKHRTFFVEGWMDATWNFESETTHQSNQMHVKVQTSKLKPRRMIPPVRKSTQTSKRSGEKSRKRDKGGRGRVTKRLRTETARYHIIKVIGVDMTTAKDKLRITTI